MTSNRLKNKRIVVGLSGSIAAYKTPDLIRRLRQAGAEVRVVMTAHAKAFITPLTLQAVSGFPVHDDLFDLSAEAAMGHIELARWADLVLIAPASADTIARLAHGFANDLLSAIVLASTADIFIVPAMNQGMWHARPTQRNIAILEKEGIHVIGPGVGSQACGEYGLGRMSEPEEIMNSLDDFLIEASLSGVNVLITSGPTQEPLDPIRYLSNVSSGKMGFALANAAVKAGANVQLISGPVNLRPPFGTKLTLVKTAQEMYDAVMKNVKHCDIFCSVAAVVDYRAASIAKEKIHKTTKSLIVELVSNPDILSTVGHLTDKPFVVGFAAETEANFLENAKVKKQKKNVDLMIANQVNEGMGMATDDNEVYVLEDESLIKIERMDKKRLAQQLMAMIAEAYRKKHHERNTTKSATDHPDTSNATINTT